MTAHPEIHADSQNPDNAGIEQVVQLYTVLALVERMTDSPSPKGGLPDEPTMISAYCKTAGVSRRAFRTLAHETAISAASGANVLVNRGTNVNAAARQLANHMRQELRNMADIAGVPASGS